MRYRTAVWLWPLTVLTLALAAGCSHPSEEPAPAAVPYTPPGTPVAQGTAVPKNMPAADVQELQKQQAGVRH